MHSAQSSIAVIKQAGRDLENPDLDHEYQLEKGFLLEVEMLCENDSSSQLTISAVYHAMTAAVLDVTTPLGTFSCNRSSPLSLSLHPEQPEPTSASPDPKPPRIHRIRLPLGRTIQSGSSLLLTNTGPVPLLYLARVGPTTQTPNPSSSRTSEAVAVRSNLDNELHYFRAFVQDTPFFERFMGRNRHVRFAQPVDYSQLLLVVACTAFVCLCVISVIGSGILLGWLRVIVIVKLGGPRKSLIDVFDVALLQEEAPVLLFQPGKGRYENSDSCCICMEDFQTNEEISQIQKCSHRLHPSCLEQWVTRTQQCPLCKVSLLLTRQLVMINSKKAKLYGTQGLSKREIAQIESRLKVDQSSRFYFMRPPPRKILRSLDSINPSPATASDGIKHRLHTKHNRSRRMKSILKQKCTHIRSRYRKERTKTISSPAKDIKKEQSQVQNSSQASTEGGLQSNQDARDHLPSVGTLLRDQQAQKNQLAQPSTLLSTGAQLDTSSANLL